MAGSWPVSPIAPTDSTDVVVIDTRDVASGPVARVHLPRRLPFGFHANWFPAA